MVLSTRLIFAIQLLGQELLEAQFRLNPHPIWVGDVVRSNPDLARARPEVADFWPLLDDHSAVKPQNEIGHASLEVSSRFERDGPKNRMVNSTPSSSGQSGKPRMLQGHQNPLNF